MSDSLSTRYRPLFIGAIFLCFLFLPSPGAGAQDDDEKTSAWYKPFYIEAGGLAVFPPKLFLGAIKPMFGFHGALGYEWGNFRFSLSSGYSYASGDNQLVESISFIPITGRVGYELPIKNNWGAQAHLGFGVQLSKTLHYETALDLLREQRSDSLHINPLAEARLRATYTLNDIFKFYAGAGADVLFEIEGPLGLPLIEAGISVKPLARLPVRKHKTVTPAPEPEPEPEPRLIPAPEPEPEPELIAEPEPEPESFYHEYWLYFEADRATKAIGRSMHLLREIGRLLRENPETHVTIRGFAAPAGTNESQMAISAARVWFCAEYLKSEFDISDHRVFMQFFGSEEIEAPEDIEWKLRRRVELIVEDSYKKDKPGMAVVKTEPYKPVPAGNNLRNFAVDFENDRPTRMHGHSLTRLREAGRLLRRNPRARVTLRGYVPSGASEDQVILSAARIWHCEEFLKWEYGVANNRVNIVFVSPEEKPVSQDAEQQQKRRVEVVVELNERR